MAIRRPSSEFDGIERKVSAGWTVAVCITLGMFSVALVTVQAATHMTNVAMFMADSVTQAAP